MRMRRAAWGMTAWWALAGALAWAAEPAPSLIPERDVAAEAKTFLDHYQQRLAQLTVRANRAWWRAALSGRQEDYDASAAASLAVRRFHRDPEALRRVRDLLRFAEQLDPVDARALRLAELAYLRNQLPEDLLKRLVDLSTEIERIFSTFRGELEGRRRSNNELLEMLADERDSDRRRAIWEALKQVGGAVAPKLAALARLRNEAAAQLGFANFWEMEIRLQEHDPDQLLGLFAKLDALTAEPFARMKARLDAELARRFQLPADQLMPWHYDNPFFQAPPPSEKVDLDEFYEDKKAEEIVQIARRFYADIGLPVDEVLQRSDLYPREGKNQHAFCSSIDRRRDVRILCNIRPTAEWMDTTLHELGHAVYELGIDPELPFSLREPAHAFTTEGVAMLFGALAKNPTWLVGYAGADRRRVDELAEAVLEQRRREQLIFARWTMVMLHFERALYENPDRPLNALWWDYVERYQRLRRPAGRDQPDWAAKPHFTVAPVYYHNYMLGELFASQLRRTLADAAGHQGPTATLSFNGRRQFGQLLNKNVFRPGSRWAWPELVRRATGRPLSVESFAQEVR